MTEDEILTSIFAKLPHPPDDVAVPPGDDCAALKISDDTLMLLTVDQLVGDKHYLMRKTRPEEAGRKLLARNLSDIAAMGGTPTYCLLAVATPVRGAEQWVQRFVQGVLTLARLYDVHLIGGDLATAPHDQVAGLTLVGTVSPRRVCLRSGARPGDGLFATGCFGQSFETGHHLSFSPRCREARFLAENATVTAMIDVSDGLLLDAFRICRASTVGLRLNLDSVPRRTVTTTQGNALYDGEDHELLVALDSKSAETVTGDWPFKDVCLTHIGDFYASGTPEIRDTHNTVLAHDTPHGYDHFALHANH
ncbi:MAG: thiamine-phosphate kinase [Candidatus Pacebacteria bacterium]|nr:thiamine-phosphate kinase [Candidatus Paceibacterota bacterium]